MRLHRFYIGTPISEDKFDITDRELVYQWKNVFRYNVGSQVILFDGSGKDFIALITSLRAQGATVEVYKKVKAGEKPKINLWLCVGIIKKDNFELVTQKATELGVCHVIPILCERSEKKNLNMERLQRIAIESSEQSGRGDIPVIHAITKVSELISQNILPSEKIVLNLEGEYIGDTISSRNPREIAVFIGPEGGWTEKELKEFELAGISAVSLGTQVLRAETAAIAIASLLLL